MTTERELLVQALDALEKSRVFVTTREKTKHPEGTEWYDERIASIRAHLAQPEHDQVRVLREALSDFVACHACGGFVQPEGEVIDAARAALEATKP